MSMTLKSSRSPTISAVSLARDKSLQALDLANVAYRGGATTNIEVIDAERQARDAATYAELAADTARQARRTMLTATDRFPESTRNPT
jgi:outer membrane protein TolC